MTDELMTAFDDSLNALAAGEPVSAILARYPNLSAELGPMLEAAQAARQLGAGAEVPRAAQQRSRAQMLARAAALRSRPRGLLGLAAMRTWALANRAVAITLAFALGFVFGTYGVLSASAASLPGDALYGLKRTVEQTQLLLAFDPRAREQLAADFDQRRVQEVERLLANARQAPVTFGGPLESVQGEQWTVAGITVTVPNSAEVIGTPYPGLYVAVTGLSQTNGTVIATRVEVTGLNLLGRVRSQSASAWQIDDTFVQINEATLITGSPRPGDLVRVTARRQPDGTWLALEIALEGDAAATPPSAATVTALAPTAASPAATATAVPALPTATSPAPTVAPAVPTSTPAAPTPQPVEVRFTGVLEARGAQTWQVAGRVVIVTAATEIRDDPQVGQVVEVRALQSADGTLTALRIEPDSSSGGSGTSGGGDDSGGDDSGGGDDGGSGDDDGSDD